MACGACDEWNTQPPEQNGADLGAVDTRDKRLSHRADFVGVIRRELDPVFHRLVDVWRVCQQ